MGAFFSRPISGQAGINQACQLVLSIVLLSLIRMYLQELVILAESFGQVAMGQAGIWSVVVRAGRAVSIALPLVVMVQTCLQKPGIRGCLVIGSTTFIDLPTMAQVGLK